MTFQVHYLLPQTVGHNVRRHSLRQECRDLEGQETDQELAEGQRKWHVHDFAHHSTRRSGESLPDVVRLLKYTYSSVLNRRSVVLEDMLYFFLKPLCNTRIAELTTQSPGWISKLGIPP